MDMTDSQVSAAEIEAYQACIGRSISETDTVGAQVGARMAATLDRLPAGDALPAMWHYGLFQNSVPTGKLGSDGHPPRGEFMPSVSLPRRMFAGATIKFHRLLSIGKEVIRTSRIASVEHRRGKTGDLVFVRLRITITQVGAVCIEEEQTIVYRAAGARVAPVQAIARAALKSDEKSGDWTPSTVELFRYSSVTFNSHRIHYDRQYAIEEEGYPDLIVHGPLTATRLFGFAEAVAGGNVSSFNFRGEAPIFVNQPVRFIARLEGNTWKLRAERVDGAIAMSATAIL